jgi:cysteine desulfuration protein SufE
MPPDVIDFDSTSIEQIIDDFTYIDSPEERYQYVIALGRSLPAIDATLKTESNRVQGCQSNVWVIGEKRGTADSPTVHLTADSDALIVKGIVAILLLCYSDKSPQEILAFPVETTLEQLGLTKFLTPMRSNGTFSMVKRIRALAQEAAA